MEWRCDDCGALTENDQSMTFQDGFVLERHRCDKCHDRWERELAWESKGETINEDEIVCPYCNTSYEDYDAYAFDEGKTAEVECFECGRKFDLEVEVKRTYSTKRSLCEMPDDWNEVGDDA